MKYVLAVILLLALTSTTYADEPTTVIQRYYCIAGDKPLTADADNWFAAGSVDISAQPFTLWCEPVY